VRRLVTSSKGAPRHHPNDTSTDLEERKKIEKNMLVTFTLKRVRELKGQGVRGGRFKMGRGEKGKREKKTEGPVRITKEVERGEIGRLSGKERSKERRGDKKGKKPW